MIGKTFLQKVRESLVSCGVNFESIRMNGEKIGLGISGGADSVSLFFALKEILNEEKIPLVCVHINHHIRSREETDGDMEFVQNLVEKTNSGEIETVFESYELPEGLIDKISTERKGGTEEAARFLRYECFEKAIIKHNIRWFCLAHNLNDNLETILMRFLKGSGAGGICPVRGKYIRPLLNTERKEIENFLEEKGQTYRIDSTNLSDDYFRNKIRHSVVPFLNDFYPEWKESVITGDEKRTKDNQFLDRLASETELTPDLFEPGKEALLNRVLVKEINRLGIFERVPSDFLSDITREIRKALAEKKSFSKCFSSAEVKCDGKTVFVKPVEKIKTDSGFFVIIEKDGVYNLPAGDVTVHTGEDGRTGVFLQGKKVSEAESFPFVIRSPALGEKKQSFIIEG